MPYFLFTNLVLAGVFLSMMIDRLAGVPAVGFEKGFMTIASLLVLIGLMGVINLERGKGMRAPGVSVIRHTLEIAATAVFAIVIVGLGWQMVVG